MGSVCDQNRSLFSWKSSHKPNFVTIPWRWVPNGGKDLWCQSSPPLFQYLYQFQLLWHLSTAPHSQCPAHSGLLGLSQLSPLWHFTPSVGPVGWQSTMCECQWPSWLCSAAGNASAGENVYPLSEPRGKGGEEEEWHLHNIENFCFAIPLLRHRFSRGRNKCCFPPETPLWGFFVWSSSYTYWALWSHQFIVSMQKGFWKPPTTFLRKFTFHFHWTTLKRWDSRDILLVTKERSSARTLTHPQALDNKHPHGSTCCTWAGTALRSLCNTFNIAIIYTYPAFTWIPSLLFEWKVFLHPVKSVWSQPACLIWGMKREINSPCFLHISLFSL